MWRVPQTENADDNYESSGHLQHGLRKNINHCPTMKRFMTSMERNNSVSNSLIRHTAGVEQAVSLIRKSRPAYASILGFYGPVFVAQVRAAAETSPEPLNIDATFLEKKSKNGFSLIEPSDFTIDISASKKLLEQICRIALQSGQNLACAGEILIRAIGDGTDIARLLYNILGGKSRIIELAKSNDVPSDMLSLLLYQAVKPSVVAGARQLATLLKGLQHYQCNCPVCGSPPILGELDAKDRQWLHCSLCWHRWPGIRTNCNFCTKQAGSFLEYFYSNDEPEYRVNLCGRCRRYLKVVDTRQLDRKFYPPLEQVVSLHLDLLAVEKGYTQY
jgi:FdhE protein